MSAEKRRYRALGVLADELLRLVYADKVDDSDLSLLLRALSCVDYIVTDGISVAEVSRVVARNLEVEGVNLSSALRCVNSDLARGSEDSAGLFITDIL